MTYIMLPKMDTQTFLSRFQPIDFSEIHSIAQNLTGTGQQLDVKELQSVIDIISQWCETIIDRITERSRYIQCFKTYFMDEKQIFFNRDMFEESAAPLAYLTGTELYLHQLLTAEEELHVHKKSVPEKPMQQLGTTKYEKLLSDKQHKMNMLIHAKKERQLLRTVHRIQKSWKQKLKDHELFIEISKQADRFSYLAYSNQISALKNLVLTHIVVSEEKLRSDLLKILRIG